MTASLNINSHQSIMNKHHFNSTISIIAIAVLGYLIYTMTVGFHETWLAIKRLGFIGVWVILGLSLLNYTLRFMRWQWYLTTIQPKNLSLIYSLRYYIAGFAFTTTPGKAGEMVRSLFLKQHTVSYPHSISMFFVERLLDLLAMLILSALILWQFTTYQYWIIVPIIISIILLILIQQDRLFEWLRTIFMNSSHWSKFFNQLFELIHHARLLLKQRFLYGGFILGLLSWGAEAYGFYYILYMLGISINPLVAMGIYALSVVIGVLSFLPGGLGSTEASMLILLSTLGVSQEDALATTLICRFATLWFAVALGAIAMIGLELHTKE